MQLYLMVSHIILSICNNLNLASIPSIAHTIDMTHGVESCGLNQTYYYDCNYYIQNH